jgi:hypothetical protein
VFETALSEPENGGKSRLAALRGPDRGRADALLMRSDMVLQRSKNSFKRTMVSGIRVGTEIETGLV